MFKVNLTDSGWVCNNRFMLIFSQHDLGLCGVQTTPQLGIRGDKQTHKHFMNSGCKGCIASNLSRGKSLGSFPGLRYLLCKRSNHMPWVKTIVQVCVGNSVCLMVFIISEFKDNYIKTYHLWIIHFISNNLDYYMANKGFIKSKCYCLHFHHFNFLWYGLYLNNR